MSTFDWDDRTVQLTVAAISDRGLVRAENQDQLLVADLSKGPGEEGILLRMGGSSGDGTRPSIPPPQHSSDDDAPLATPIPHSVRLDLGPRGLLAVVADGMGGAAAGALASDLAVTWIHDLLTARIEAEHNDSPRHFARRLQEVVKAANAKVYDESRHDPRHFGMGSTVTAAGIIGTFLFLAQVGDSRAYLVRHGTAYQLTRDQSLVQELVDAGSLTEEEADHSPQRHILLQALGTEPDVRPELTYQELRRGDTILLCSDGLHGVIGDKEIASLTTYHEPAAACTALVDLANARGGPDNITVVVLLAEGDGLELPDAGDTVGRQLFS